MDSVPVDEFDSRSRLLTVAEPVLAELAEDFADSGYSAMLADHQGRLIGARFGDSRIRDSLMDDGVLLGDTERGERLTSTASHDQLAPVALLEAGTNRAYGLDLVR